MLSLALLAQIASGPHAIATRVASPPVLDGRLTDAAWGAAEPQSSFVQKFPVERASPSERTSFRIVYDDDDLYIGITCEQRIAPIVHRLTRRDRIVESDRVTVVVDSRGDAASAYEFTVNASGVQADAIRFNDVEIDRDWDETWDANVADTESGWSAEIRIPLRILRFSEGVNHAWGLQVRRYISLRQETDEWAFIPRAEAGEISRYGRLDGIGAIRKQGGLELRPFVVGRVDRRDPGSETLGQGASASASAGVDLKWHPRRDLTLDATLNPDFAQVEADQLVLNLTNYEIVLPEKRPFFLEGRDVFATPLPLLYSRRIGRVAPDPPALPSGHLLVDPTEPAALLGAQKLTGRIADRTSVGTLSALTARNDVEVEDAAGRRRAFPVEATTLFQAVRVKREVGDNGHVGVMATSVIRSEATPAYLRDQGAVLCPDGSRVASGQRCVHDAYVGAADARWRSSGGAYAASAQIVGSAIREGPPRLFRDGTVIASGDAGVGGKVRLAKEGGVPWVADVEYEGASRRLDFNDAGYMRRQNVHALAANLEYRTLEPWYSTIETHSRLEIFGRRSLDGRRLAEGYQINTAWKFPSFSQLFMELHWRRNYFDDREVGDGTALERADLLGLEIEGKTDPRKRIAVEFETQTQRVFGGFAFRGHALVTIRVLPELDLSLGPEATYVSGEPRFAGRAPGALVFGDLEAGNLGNTLRATYTFTPRISLQAYAQLFLAAGHYSAFTSVPEANSGAGRVIRMSSLAPAPPPSFNPDFREAALNANVVLRWEYALGSTLFLVYTRTQAPSLELLPGQRGLLDVGGIGRAPATDTLLLKLSYFFG